MRIVSPFIDGVPTEDFGYGLPPASTPAAASVALRPRSQPPLGQSGGSLLPADLVLFSTPTAIGCGEAALGQALGHLPVAAASLNRKSPTDSANSIYTTHAGLAGDLFARPLPPLLKGRMSPGSAASASSRNSCTL